MDAEEADLKMPEQTDVHTVAPRGLVAWGSPYKSETPAWLIPCTEDKLERFTTPPSSTCAHCSFDGRKLQNFSLSPLRAHHLRPRSPSHRSLRIGPRSTTTSSWHHLIAIAPLGYSARRHSARQCHHSASSCLLLLSAANCLLLPSSCR